MPCTLGTHGRRKLASEKSSEKRKRRYSKELRKIDVFLELTHAAPVSLGYAGKTDADKHVSEALERTPKGALRIRNAWGAHAKDVSVPYTAEELFLFTKAHLAKTSVHKNSKASKNAELQYIPKLPCN
jgi:hypothetical protein